MSLQDIIFSSLANLQTDEGDLRGVLNHILNTKNGSWVPPIDIIDNKEMLCVYIELPGIHQDIKVNFLNNKLIISGKKQCSSRIDTTVIKNEIGYGKYSRTIILPIHIINKKNVTTKYENGLLCININKKNEDLNQFVINIELTDDN